MLLSAGLCLEKRVFYRLISGLHSSINIHLCAEHLLDGTAFSEATPSPELTLLFFLRGLGASGVGSQPPGVQAAL